MKKPLLNGDEDDEGRAGTHGPCPRAARSEYFTDSNTTTPRARGEMSVRGTWQEGLKPLQC